MDDHKGRVIFDRVWKKFHRGVMHDSLRDLIPAVAKRIVGHGPKTSELEDGDFWAVKDLSFEVNPGQTLGIIGPNGSGKSTTLKMLTKILAPSRGRSYVQGRVGTLIEVSAGFHGDLTGRENVFLQGAIMGMKNADIVRKFDEIVEFSGVSDSIDTQVKRYSSGMNARLGFSIAAHLEPDVLIIDEVLAVGDLTFQEKAFGRIRALAGSGIPVVMVSHQLDRIAELCSEAILLTRGEVLSRGTADETISKYIKQHDAARVIESNGPVTLTATRLLTEGPVPSGGRFEVEIEGHISRELTKNDEPIAIRVRSLRTSLFVFSFGSLGVNLGLTKPGPFRVRVSMQANMHAGGYIIEIASRDMLTSKDSAIGPSAVLNVVDSVPFAGALQMNPVMQTV